MKKRNLKRGRSIAKTRVGLVTMLAGAFALPVATTIVVAQAGGNTPARPQGPCDIYTAAGLPCVAAHSSTRALYAAYNGPLYQVMRQSDGKTLDIGVVQPSANDAGGYANAVAQDEFCANTYCWITVLYDQSDKKNHLVQAPRGGFSGPAMGGFNNLPIADMAPVTVMGHKVYGIFIEPGMGLRQNDAKGTAVDDQAEGQYWVINGRHYNGGCCFDYGNAETDSRDDGDGTMETTYYGNATAWYRGSGRGPWIMTDQENNLVGCVNPDGSKVCNDLPSIDWQFVTATADGEPHHWRSMGGDAQQGELKVMFDGGRIGPSYDPMRKQGAILLGNGGDNSNGSQGTFYEGAMTAPNTFPTQEVNQKIQANIVAAKYTVARVGIAPAAATATPPGLQTVALGSAMETVVSYTNTTSAPVTDLKLALNLPAGWKADVASGNATAATVAPGASVSATFKVTSGPAAFNGDLVGVASWKNANGSSQSETAIEKVRNVNPIKINEFAISSGTPANATNSFIELYNASDSAVDISGWSLTQHPTQQPIFSSVKVPAGTKLPAKGFYLMGLSNSGLAVPAKKGDAAIFVRDVTGMQVGSTVEIGTGSGVEVRKITDIRTPAAPQMQGPGGPMGGFGGGRQGAGGLTTLWQPVPDGPVITIPVGSKNIPVTSTGGFEVGQKMAIGYGSTYPTVAGSVEKYEVVTVTEVGKPGTQAWLSMDAKAGDKNIKVSSVANISVGDKIRLDIDTLGYGIETVTVAKVGTQSVRSTFNGPLKEGEDAGTGLELVEPLKFNHASNMPFSSCGTGISFEPATAFEHSSNEPVLALGTVVTLDKPLDNDHEINAVVRDEKVTTAGYQGEKKADLLFGGPALGGAGNMVLRDAAGLVIDSLNYGGLIDPWAAEGYQGNTQTSSNGCSVAAPNAGGRGGFGGRPGATPAAAPNRSAGRYPDGADTDSNCSDFLQQTSSALALASAAGTTNIKVASVSDLAVGQTVIIDSGENTEKAVITAIGTPGASTVTTATTAGATVIPVASAAGFSVGQTITIDSGDNAETVVVSAISGGGRGPGGFGGPGGPGGRGGQPANISITVASAMAKAHASGVQVSGSGITLAAALTKAHEGGTIVAGSVPTPGAANQYSRR